MKNARGNQLLSPFSAPRALRSYVEPAIPFAFDAVPNIVDWLQTKGNDVHNFHNVRQFRFLRVGDRVQCSFKTEVSVEMWSDFDTTQGQKPLMTGLPDTPLTMAYFSAAPAALCLGKKTPKIEQMEKQAAATKLATAAAAATAKRLAEPAAVSAASDDCDNDDIPLRASLPVFVAAPGVQDASSTSAARVPRARVDRATRESEAARAARVIEEARQQLLQRSQVLTDLYGDDEPMSYPYNKDPRLLDLLDEDGTLRSWEESSKTLKLFMRKVEEAGQRTGRDVERSDKGTFVPSETHLLSQRAVASIKAFVEKIRRPQLIDVSPYRLCLSSDKVVRKLSFWSSLYPIFTVLN